MEYEVPRIDVRGATNCLRKIYPHESCEQSVDDTNSFNRSGSGQEKAVIVSFMRIVLEKPELTVPERRL